MTVHKKKLDFKAVNDAAMRRLRDLLADWFPNGTLVDGKREFAVGNIHGDAGGADGGSFKINLRTGAWGEMNGGEPAGGDIVALYAHKFCAGNMPRACEELAAKLGVDAAAPVDNVVPMPKREAEEWRPIVPPPDDARPREPFTGGWDHKYEYRDQAGKLLRYVVRRDAVYDGDTLKKKKVIRPLTWGFLKSKENPKGKEGWHYKAPDDPRSLYGLERLDGREVLLQEGEGKTDSVQARLPGLACLSLTMGTAGKLQNDLKPLAGLTVIMCGDADPGGVKAAEDVALQLLAMGCIVTLVDTSMMPPGWDLGNACAGFMRCKKTGAVIWREDPWDGERIESFLRANGRRFYGKDREPEPETGPDFDPDFDGSAADERRQYGGADYRHLAPIALGYDCGIYYYLSQSTGQIEALSRSRHVKNELIGIAPLAYWGSLEEFNGKEGTNWTGIGDWLKNGCHRAGVYNPDRMRGRGAWLDTDRETGEKRAVMNVGNRLIVDGVSLPLRLPGSDYFYEAALPLEYMVAEPLTKEQAGQVAELCKMFCWDKPIYGTLMAGWLAVAPICGALFWRPAIWLTGGSGSGKSTLENLIAKPLLGGIGLFVKGGTTEAGIRQKMGRDARPIWVDEAEAESAKGKTSMQGLLDLNRQSSSEGGAEIIKGTQNQTGAKTYHVRSCFAFSSINPTLDHMADENRMSVLELTNHNAEARAGFDAFVDRIGGTITPEFAAGFIARSVWLMPVILDNARTFAKAVTVHLGSSRIGDQVGTLLAGAFSGVSDKRVSFEAARKWVEDQDWGGATSIDALPDERRLLNCLMQTRGRLDLGSKIEDLTLEEMIKLASGANGDALAVFANNELKRHGLAWDDAKRGVWVSNSHMALKAHLAGTAWGSQWPRALRRLPGAEPMPRDAAPIRFAGSRDRATFLPMALIE